MKVAFVSLSSDNHAFSFVVVYLTPTNYQVFEYHNLLKFVETDKCQKIWLSWCHQQTCGQRIHLPKPGH